MSSLIACGHSFIIRVWLEETIEESDQTIWRGRVTHVPSHEQRYFQDLNDLIVFIQDYTKGWGGETG